MVDTATAKYLSDNVGEVLAKALADMAVAQPADGVDFLSRWLRLYAEQEEDKQRHRDEMKELEEQRVKTKAAQEAKEEKLKAQAEEVEAKSAKYEDLMEKFSNPETTFEDSFWADLVDVAQTVTGAKSVYIGLLEEEGLDGEAPGPCVAYTATSEGSEWLQDRVLPDQTGVTWGALKLNPEEEDFAKFCLWRPPAPPPPDPDDKPEPVEGEEPPAEDAEGEADKAPTLPYYPVNIPCVTDVDEVHYFDMTRLGAYLAVPLVYPSYYTADALADAKQFETEKKAEDLAREEARVAKEAELEAAKQALEQARQAAEAAGEPPPEEPEEPPAEEEEVPEKQMVLRGKDVKMVLCLDTLGTNALIEESKIQELLELCKACALCKSQTETKYVDTQALLDINQEERTAAEERVAEARKQVDEDAELKAAEDAEMAEVPAEEEDKKDMIKEKHAWIRAKTVVQVAQEEILKLTSWVVATPELMALVANLAMLLGYTKEQVYPKKKSVLIWDKLVTVLAPPLFEALDTCDLIAERKGLSPEYKLNSIRENGLKLDDETAKALWPTVELLVVALRQACTYRAAYLKWRRSEFEKEKAAKEAEEEAFTAKPLEEVDDDFVE